MKIKTANTQSILSTTYLLLGALAAFLLITLLVGNLRRSPVPHKTTLLGTLPTATLDFMKKPATLLELLQFFKEHDVLLSVKDEASMKMSASMREELAKMGGIELANIELRESYVGHYRNGKFVKERANKKEAVSLTFENGKVYSGGKNAGNFSKFDLGDLSWNGEKRGLNVFVVSRTGQLLGVWNYDFFKEENPTSKTERYVPDFFEGVEFIELEIKEKHFAKLKKKRDQAMRTKLLLTEEDDYVPAKVIYGEQKLKADIRLKGDWVDHLDGDNWSFRVKLDKENTLFGMRKFSLHRPETRNYMGEWLFHELLRDADILNLQYHFVQIKLNVTGADGGTQKLLGLYALEEFFDKHLIERSRRRESVILKVDEGPIWEERADFLAQGIALEDLAYTSIARYEDLPILPFGEGRVAADSTLLRQFRSGAKLFRDYLNGNRPASEVFDVERLAKFNAIANLLGGDHALIPHNYRVYFNPLTARLEPVGFDANAWTKVSFFAPYFNTKDDLIYQEAYGRALEEVTSDEYLEKIKSWPGLAERMELMALAYPELDQSFDILKSNRGIIRNALFPKRSLKVNYERLENGYMHLTIENFGRFPVEIVQVQNVGGRAFGYPTQERLILPKGRHSVAFKLDKNYNRLFISKGKKKAGFQVDEDLEGLKISFKTLGTSELRSERIFPWSSNESQLAKDNPFQKKSTVKDFAFLSIDENSKVINCQPGYWRVESPLVIPAGYTFTAGPGTRIELINYFAKIISYSALNFIGTEESPVEIFSNTGQGLGVFVLSTNDTSRIEHCRFKGLSNPSSSGWALTGAVNFYEAPVLLNKCVFSENRCEDALNVFRTYFELDNSLFTDIHADAIDGDFVRGSVTNTQFNRIGNDAVDVSGSEILVDNVLINEAGDKGLSAGEDSRMTAIKVTVLDSEIALASKDKSVLKISRSSLKNNALGFTAFQKKPEFGPAVIEADSIDLIGNEVEHLIEHGSALLLDGQAVPTSDGVIERMYGEEFGRKSGI